MTLLNRLRKFFAPLPEFNDRWRCSHCKAEGEYKFANDLQSPGHPLYYLDLKCGDKRPNTACPLAPIDADGNELTYEEWKRSSTLKK